MDYQVFVDEVNYKLKELTNEKEIFKVFNSNRPENFKASKNLLCEAVFTANGGDTTTLDSGNTILKLVNFNITFLVPAESKEVRNDILAYISSFADAFNNYDINDETNNERYKIAIGGIVEANRTTVEAKDYQIFVLNGQFLLTNALIGCEGLTVKIGTTTTNKTVLTGVLNVTAGYTLIAQDREKSSSYKRDPILIKKVRTFEINGYAMNTIAHKIVYDNLNICDSTSPICYLDIEWKAGTSTVMHLENVKCWITSPIISFVQGNMTSLKIQFEEVG